MPLFLWKSGSPIENWHSIMRKGLVNASRTKLQLNGAAYGSGIYLSPESSVSFNYMASPITFGLRVVGSNVRFMVISLMCYTIIKLTELHVRNV